MPCPICQQPLSSENADSTPESAAGGELVDALPTLLALPLAELLQEPNPVLALWAACDLVEIALKLCVMTGLTEHPKPPEDLLRQLRDKVELPTLGKWMGMARAVAKHRPTSPNAASSLPLSETIAALDSLLGPSGAAVDAGLLPLRNRLAHGGPMGRREADALLNVWKPKVVALAEGPLRWLCDARLIAVAATGARVVLRGEHAQETIEDAAIPGDAPVGSAWLVVGKQTLHLGPLGAFDPKRDALELYVRRGEVRLQYLRMGEDGGLFDSTPEAMETFRNLFAPPPSASDTRLVIRGFEPEVRKEAGRRIGREAELATLIDAVSRGGTGHLWMGGAAGMGKSNLMASLCEHVLDEAERGDLPDTLVLPYRFRAGDDRRGRTPFLTYLRERLIGTPWVSAPAELKEDAQNNAVDPVTEVRTLLASLRDGARVLLLLDGLDEAVEVDPRFMDDVVFRIVNERVSVIGAGRPERGIPEAFRAQNAADPFPNGLPPMSENDVRALLLERTGPVRKRLLGRDQDKGGAMHNAFIAAVAKRSDGLPIYINYVVGDLNAGKLSVDAVDALPAGLHQYHDELLRRAAVGDLQAVATPTLVLLALAHEPLTVLEIATLLRLRGLLDTVDVALVERAIAALAAMVRRAPDPDGEEGYALFHHSLRTHMLGAPELRQTVAVTRSALADLASTPERAEEVAVYLYRCGVRHLLEADRGADALTLMTDFARTMSRLQRLAGTGRAVGEWYADWERARQGATLDRTLGLWEAFMREREHMLRRGDAEWPANRILLQLAVEHADDSPVTKAAEAWLEKGACDWVWLKRSQRVAHAAASPCLRVLEGHTSGVNGALSLPDGRLLSWSGDGTLRLWDGATGAALVTLEGHTKGVKGALALPDGRLLSWSWDKTLRLWDGATGAAIVTLVGHTDSVYGALALPDGRLLSWSHDKTLRLWDGATGVALVTLEGHAHWVYGALALPDGRLLSWSGDHTLRLWDGATGAALATLEGHTRGMFGALALPDGRLLSWSRDRALRMWDGATGAALVPPERHTDSVEGAFALPDGRLLSWSDDDTLRLWDGTTGAPLDCVDRTEVHTHPALYLARRTAMSPDTVQQHTFAQGNPRGLALFQPGHTTRWHTDGGWKADHLLPDGTIIAHCGKHLAILHLHHGNRRMSVEEAERLPLPDRVEPT